jgi:hypothetical protein
LTAAFVNALTSVLQRIGVESKPSSTTMRLSLMSHAIRRGVWLIELTLMLVVFALQAMALRFGRNRGGTWRIFLAADPRGGHLVPTVRPTSG